MKQEEFWDDPAASISKAYLSTDQTILSHSSDLGHGGSTAVTAILINGQTLWTANVGDSRAVLSRKGKAVQLTTDHEPNTERGSIENKGGFVSNMPDYREIQSSGSQCSREISTGNQNQMTESLKIAEAPQVHMEVQKKLYEQIEVQKHLQLRIDAQGKYLQSVLMKAQEALTGYSSSTSILFYWRSLYSLVMERSEKALCIFSSGCRVKDLEKMEKYKQAMAHFHLILRRSCIQKVSEQLRQATIAASEKPPGMD